MSSQKRYAAILLALSFASPIALEAAFNRNLSVGMSGADVRELQVLLNKLPATRVAATGPGSPGFETTSFGGLTFQAVKAFQLLYASEVLHPAGLRNPTGFVGALTRQKLNSLAGAGQTATAQVTLSRDLFLSVTGEDVRALQKLLNAKGYVVAATGPGSPGNETSIFGFATEAAVRRFQCKELYICSGAAFTTGYGLVDAKTRAKLGTSVTSTSSTAVLAASSGMSGTRVSPSSGGSSGGSSASPSGSSSGSSSSAGASSGGSSSGSSGSGSATAPTPVPTGIVIDDFDATTSDWGFYNGAEYPGASGGFSTASGRSGNGGRISFTFGGAARYVIAERQVSIPASATELSIWAKAPAATSLLARLVDSTGQTLMYSMPRSLESIPAEHAWVRHTIQLSSPVGFWDGASDGIVHYPIRTIQIGVEPVRYTIDGVTRHSVTSGTIDFDDISYNEPPLTIDPSSSTVYPLASNSVQSTIGFSIHGNNYNDWAYDKLSELGARTVRADFMWDGIETAEGVYDFSLHDSVASSLNARGMKVLFILAYGNPLYGLVGNTGPTTSEQIEKFGAFAKAASQHYAGQNVMWEIWNEPNLDVAWLPTSNAAQYAELSRTAIAKIREGNPSAQIVTGGISDFDYDWIADMISAGGAQNADAIGVHPYRSESPERIVSSVVVMRSLISEKTGRSIPLWNTEWGYSSEWFGHGASTQGQRIQAKLVVRQTLTSLIAGFPFNAYYDLTNDSLDPSEANMNFGLYSKLGVRKLAGQALELLHANTSGWSVAGIIPTGRGDLHVLKLQSGSSIQFIAWIDTNSPGSNSGSVPLRLSRQPSAITGLLGEALGYTSDNGTYIVQVTDEPMYIRF